MTLEFTGRKAHVTPDLRALAERKLQKLSKVLRITKVHVILASDRRGLSAEVKIHSPQLDLVATERGEDATLALGSVLDKLTRQAMRHIDRRRERRRRQPVKETTLWSGVVAPTETPGEKRRIIRSRRFVVASMTMDKAAAAAEASEEGFVVYRDQDTNRIKILYRRRDGHLGLIEPEP